MRPTPSNYAIWPTIVPANETTEMIIAPTERAFLLFEGEEYTVVLMHVNGDETSYHAPTCMHPMTVVAKDGVLRFPCHFEGEMEHTIHLIYNEKLLQVLSVYSLEKDLYALRPLRGDLHSHSYRSDGKRDPAALAGHFREQGYDFFALTDHNRFYPGGEIDQVFNGVKCGFTRVTGEEIHAPGSVVHIVHVGGNESVANRYIHDRETFLAEVEACMARVPEWLPDNYRDRYAKALWATDKIHEAGGLAIFAHPYWKPAARVYNVNDEFTRILLKSGMFDAFELVGGMGQAGVNRAVALWADMRAEGLDIPVVGSSDVHGLQKSPDFPDHFTIVFAEENSNDAIKAAIKAGRSLAVEANGYEYDRQYRCYGAHRLVSYALFLLKNYFPARHRLCQGEGVAMRAYSMNETVAALVELQAKLSADFEDRFFGRALPVLPDAEMLRFEDEWRKTHVEVGPPTKGSEVDAPPVTRQI